MAEITAGASSMLFHTKFNLDQCIMSRLRARNLKFGRTDLKYLRAPIHRSERNLAHDSRMIPLSVSPNSDESDKQSLYPDGDPDGHQNLIVCSVAHCQPSLKISCKSVRKFLHKVANKETDRQTTTTSGYALVVHGRPKTPKSFWGSPSPRGRAAPIF